MTATRIFVVAVVGWAVVGGIGMLLLLALGLSRTAARPDPVDAHAATVPTDIPAEPVPDPVSVERAAEVAALEAALKLPDHIREDH